MCNVCRDKDGAYIRRMMKNEVDFLHYNNTLRTIFINFPRFHHAISST